MPSKRLTSRLLSLLLVAGTLLLGAAGSPAAQAAGEGSRPDAKPSAAALAAPGELAGTISTSDGGGVYGELEIYQWQADGEFFDYFDSVYLEDEFGDPVPSPQDYALEVPQGHYYVEFDDYSGDYLTGYGNGAAEPAVDLTSDGVVEVTSEAGAEADVALLAAPDRQPVTGVVQDPGGAGLFDVYVEAYEVDGGEFGDTFTAADGTYELQLRPGTYEVYFDANDYENAMVEVTVGESGATIPPVTLTPLGRFTVSGSVVGEGDVPLDGATATLFRLYDYDDDGIWDDYEFVDEAETDGSGAYSFSEVRGSRTYTVGARAPGYGFGVIGGFSEVTDAEGVLVQADMTVADVVLQPATTLSGTVSGPDGPAADVLAELYQWDADADEFFDIDGTYTDENGDYSYDSLDPGFYTLYFDASDSAENVQSAWLEGTDAPASTSAPGVFEVTDTPTALVRDKTLPGALSATGRITDGAGTGLADGSVVSYVFVDHGGGDTGWEQYDTSLSEDDGSFRVRVPAESTVTFRFARGGFQPQFLGGGDSLPATPNGTNSRTTGTEADVDLGPIALAPFVSALGKVAGQDLDFCRTNAVPANDDGSSEAVTIPFDLEFFGTSHDELYVNNNGNVTFGESLSQYTPEDLTGPTAVPIIAPFFADVDTRGAGSNVVTYGASPDGNTLCVNWADVGYFSSHDEHLNTFQLLMTKNTTGAGRGPGDFDITFNYDEILWETGDASGGGGGQGGTSAAAGFSAGLGDPGTFVQLPGSLVNGALLDGGPNALISGSQNSSQVGRYVYQVRNEGLVSTLGDLEGTVIKAADDSAVESAYVQACRADDSGCSYTETGASGGYSFAALPVGDYEVRVWPPDDSLFGGGALATVVAGETTTVDPIALEAPMPLPPNAQITNNGVGENGVPSVYYGDPLELQVTGCAGIAAPTYTVTLASGEVIRNALPMTESPAGTYTATIEPLVPHTGDATIATNIPAVCGGEVTDFNVYIDPSGIVTDQYGRPLEGVTVTLLRSDTFAGEYTMVPDGSDIMSPSNRDNPSITDETGFFRWDVQTGWYKVRVEIPGCTTTTTDGMEVPPERIDLLIKMACTAAAPTPTTAPTVSGTPKVGETITAQPALWADPLVSTGVELLRNGTPLPTASHQLTDADVGATFTARATGQRPDYVTEGGAGETVTFTSVTATSAPVTGVTGDAPTASTKPAISGTPKVGQPLAASTGTWNLTGLTYSYQWLRAGTAIGGATASSYTAGADDVGKAITVRVTASKAGYADGTSTSNAITVGKYTSTTKAKLAKAKIRTNQRGSLTVTVSVPGLADPTGQVKIRDRSKVIATVALTAAKGGVLKVKLPKLKKGKHKLSAEYLGSETVTGSISSKQTLKVIKKKKRKR